MIAHDASPVWPHAGAPSIREIGIGLGRQPRFAGQTRLWYSVLAHTLAVASITPPEHRAYALLHDAHESILGDCPSTWKDEHREDLENRLQARIYVALGIPWPSREASAAIKRADLACLAAEAHILGHAEAEHYWPSIEVDADAVNATNKHLAVCRSWLDANRAGARLKLAYKRATRGTPTDPTSSMPETFLEAAALRRERLVENA